MQSLLIGFYLRRKYRKLWAELMVLMVNFQFFIDLLTGV